MGAVRWAAAVLCGVCALGPACAASPQVGGSRVPRHIAFIPDGNGRWATRRGLRRAAGHAAGERAALAAARRAFAAGCEVVTLFALSTENERRRESDEVAHIAALVRVALQREVRALGEQGIHLHCAGWPEGADRAELARAVAELRPALVGKPPTRVLCLAFAYGGRADLARACRRIAALAAQGLLDPAEVDEGLVARHLATGPEGRAEELTTLPEGAGLPDVDLVVRSAGDRRLSNFALWQCAYAELAFARPLWPDFGDGDLEAALEEYARAERRFGGLPEAEGCRG